MKNKIVTTNKIDIRSLLIDMAKKTPTQVYVKYGVGIQTQIKIKESIVASIRKEEMKIIMSKVKRKSRKRVIQKF